ncbi:lysophosphatidylserine lipase ABHD12 isoform X1 [Musca domestica]|uniref:Lysophosphatidylserine lipase ABHD12 isoform X1 n=1 Tax=Musca domestica TaxID=7370 RepID=A0A1I8MK37_MUSDO|nr:lysophosphatidylserine lipase ABHD12 isoform X1 [Musca domestica]XP_058986455.1 lysophosphatidylserine lipase ABHD12 isoform X1 [Musca domestica]
MYESYNFLNSLFRATIIPGLFVIVWLTGLISLVTVQICLLAFSLVFIVFPLVFRYSVTLQRGILFLTFITYPRDLDLSNPASVGLYATRSFHLNVPDADVEEDDAENKRYVRIGLWHVLPKHVAKRFSKELQLSEEAQEDLQNITEVSDENLDKLEGAIKTSFPVVNPENQQLFYERLLKVPGNTIVLYLHGNTASRGSGHRLDVYKLLRKLGYHVISFDYRGYGDSDPISPTEEGVVRDAMAVYNYIRNLTSNPVFIWGHSLGTGVATNMLSQLNYLNDKGIKGVILEAPFTNIKDEIRMHPFARPFKHLPWFDHTIARPMYLNSLRFESDQHISEFRQPIMILHAEDDYVVPFQLGYKLYRIALDTRGKSWGPVEFHRFEGSRKYGHKYICYAPELPDLIQKFINNYYKDIF